MEHLGWICGYAALGLVLYTLTRSFLILFNCYTIWKGMSDQSPDVTKPDEPKPDGDTPDQDEPDQGTLSKEKPKISKMRVILTCLLIIWDLVNLIRILDAFFDTQILSNDIILDSINDLVANYEWNDCPFADVESWHEKPEPQLPTYGLDEIPRFN